MDATTAPRVGKTLTSRGALRREALLDATAKHLSAAPWREASIAAIAHEAGCASALFYQHFPNLPAAARALIERERAGNRPLGPHLEAISWLLEAEDRLHEAP